MTSIDTTAPLDHGAVALRAYYLWEGEGRPDGCHEAHWFAAEAAEKRSATAPRSAATRKPKAAAPKAAEKAAASKASPKTVMAAAALSKTRGAAAGAKGSRRVH